jgi:hypothetical protein
MIFSSPSCPKCGGKAFGMSLIEPANSNFKVNTIHCSRMDCGAVVGVTDFYDVGTLVYKLARAMSIDLDNVRL